MSSIIEIAKKAKAASVVLARLSEEQKNNALLAVASSISRHREEILAANRLDLLAARPLVEAGRMAAALYDRLKLDDAKLHDIVTGIQQVVSMGDPVGRVTLATELDEGLTLYRVTCPIGVIGVIFESRPDDRKSTRLNSSH